MRSDVTPDPTVETTNVNAPRRLSVTTTAATPTSTSSGPRRLSKSVQDKIKHGSSLIRAGELDEAFSEFQSVLKSHPDAETAHFAVANIYFKQRRYEEALNTIETIKTLNPTMPQACLGAGRVYLRQGNVDKAIEEFRKALKIDPKLAQVYVSIGQVFAQQKKYEEATQMFRKGLRYDPRFIPARASLAQVYVDQGKLQEALDELKLAFNYHPSEQLEPLLYLRLGRVHMAQPDYNAAVEAFEKAIELNPDVPPARMGLVEALINLDRLEEATKNLQQIPRAPQLEPIKYKMWGDIFKRQGLHDQAEEAYRAAALMTEEDNDLADKEMEELDSLLDVFQPQ